jgi:hypothetical protein
MGDGNEPNLTRRRIAAERAAARKAAERGRRSRQYWIVGGAAILLVVVGVLAAAAFNNANDNDDDDPTPTPFPANPNDPLQPILARYESGECPQPVDPQEWRAAQAALTTPESQASAEAQVAAWDAVCGLGQAVLPMGRNHIAEGEEHEPYNSTPPTSGPHYSNWDTWGVHSDPIPNEVQIHNLEHGGVLLQYNCECPEVIALLRRFADPETGYPNKVIAAPYPDMESEIAFTAWGRIWTMSAAEVTAERIRAFLAAYLNRGPEDIPTETQALAAWRESDAPKP